MSPSIRSDGDRAGLDPLYDEYRAWCEAAEGRGLPLNRAALRLWLSVRREPRFRAWRLSLA